MKETFGCKKAASGGRCDEETEAVADAETESEFVVFCMNWAHETQSRIVKGRNDDELWALYHTKKWAIIEPELDALLSVISAEWALACWLILHETIRQMSSSDKVLSTQISVNLFRNAGESSFFPKSPPGFMVARSLKPL